MRAARCTCRPGRTGSGASSALLYSGRGDADGTSVIIPEDLPEQYKGEKREHDFIVRGERLGEVTDTESKKALLADKPLTNKSLVHCAFGGLPHCEVTTE